jgi:membrane protein DedA with SNARE-associated domain
MTFSLDFPSLVSQYGYLAVFVGCFLEGETILLLASYAARRGYLDPWLVWAVAAFAGTLGDLFFFWLGRRHGRWVLETLPRLRGKITWALVLIENHPVKLILLMRFLYGLRIALPIAMGLSRIPVQLYVPLNFLAALLWATVIVLAGYLFGAAVEVWLDELGRYEYWIMGVLAVLVLMVHGVMRRGGLRRRRAGSGR